MNEINDNEALEIDQVIILSDKGWILICTFLFYKNNNFFIYEKK